jgi:enamine deaminase RidA (YjgF/YER057c/UK114 family)
MNEGDCNETNLPIDLSQLTEKERKEMIDLGILTKDGKLNSYAVPTLHKKRPPFKKRAIHAPVVINEAYSYTKPSSFSRGLTFNLDSSKFLLVSGTASVNEEGKAAHVGDFRAQCWRTYRNITQLLESEGMSWHDVVRTTCYLRDIERDYKDFNEVRTAFFNWMGLDPLPASTGVQARLCWDDLLVEIEAIAIAPLKSTSEKK